MNGLWIVVLSYNTLALLQRCVQTLRDLGVEAGRIVVVDNGSSDGSRAWLAAQTEQGLCVLLLDENRGFAGGNNAGIRHALDSGAEFVLLLNSDAYPRPGSLERLLALMGQEPMLGVAGAQLLFENGGWQRSGGELPSPTGARREAFGIDAIGRAAPAFFRLLLKLRPRIHALEYVDGACMLLRAEMLRAIGLLDEGYFFFVEDAEFCGRARAHGYLVLQDEGAHVIHLRGGSSAQKNRLASETLKRDSLRRYIEAHYGAAGWRTYMFWSYRKFQWRAGACRAASRLGLISGERCAHYAVSLQVYDPQAAGVAESAAKESRAG